MTIFFQWLLRKLRGLTVNQIVLILFLVVVYINEFLVYTLQTRKWNVIPTNRNPEEQMVVLLVSDPQILGYREGDFFANNILARWDSDRYLSKTFSKVFHHTKPDVIVFLGDIMDEGSIASNSDFQAYLRRFRSVFYEAWSTKTIIVPGDNDIGGEEGDFRTPLKIHRFQKSFENLTGIVRHGFVDFVKMDIRLYYDDLLEKKHLIQSFKNQLKAPLRVVINHESMIPKTKGFIYPVLRSLQPNLLFSGHWHMSQMFTCPRCLTDENEHKQQWRYKLEELEHTNVANVDLKDLSSATEIMVPTCSYRMGVPVMGYGVALIDRSGYAKYTVLWLTDRHFVLFTYLWAGGILGVALVLNYILSPLMTTKKSSRRLYN